MTKLPLNSGQFTVGCSDIVSKYGIDRVLFRLYYPTIANVILTESNAAPWLTDAEYVTGYSNFFPQKVDYSHVHKLYSSVKVNAVWNGQFVLPTQISKLPVVIFSHGLGANRTGYSAICSDLASHGVLVAAVEHSDQSACATYYLTKTMIKGKQVLQKKWIDFLPGNPADEFKLRNKQVHFRANECRKLLDVIEQINKGHVNFAHCEIDLLPFKDAIDVNKCAIMGHSFGGGTAVTTLSVDNRFQVGVGLDTWMYPLNTEVYQKIFPVPFLFINSETFQWPGNIADMRKIDADVLDVNAERLMVTLAGTHHFSQCDFGFIMKTKTLQKLFNVVISTDAYVAHGLNNKLAFGFLGKHLGLNFGSSTKDIVGANSDLVYFGSNVEIDEEKLKKSKRRVLSKL